MHSVTDWHHKKCNCRVKILCTETLWVYTREWQLAERTILLVLVSLQRTEAALRLQMLSIGSIYGKVFELIQMTTHPETMQQDWSNVGVTASHKINLQMIWTAIVYTTNLTLVHAILLTFTMPINHQANLIIIYSKKPASYTYSSISLQTSASCCQRLEIGRWGIENQVHVFMVLATTETKISWELKMTAHIYLIF